LAFQALGNLYFIHECIEEVSIFDFIGKYFVESCHRAFERSIGVFWVTVPFIENDSDYTVDCLFIKKKQH